MDKEPLMKDFLKEFQRVQNNAVYFLDCYWNKYHPDKKLELSDEEKEQLFHDHRIMVPLIENMDDLRKFEEARDAKRKQGLKDWEIF